MFVAALGVRLVRLNEFPHHFWTMKQYRSAIIARAFYFESAEDIPAWRKDVVSASKSAYSEPPILEWIAAKGYGLAGRELFAIPRSITIAAWLLGGAFLLGLSRRFLGRLGALVALGIYLFLPFGVLVSRSFQCDTLMLCALLGTFAAVVRYFDRPAWGRLLVAALAASAAMLTKPGANQFAVFFVYAALALNTQGIGRAFRDARNWLFAAASILPAALYTIWNARQQGYLFFCLSSNFVPQWLGTLYFWRGWAGQLVWIFGVPVLTAGLIGLLMLRGRAQWVGWAWGMGYGLQCLLTSFTTPSHDYWHLQFLPLLAIGVGRAVAAVLSFLATRSKILPWGGVALLVFWAGIALYRHPVSNMRISAGEEYPRMAAEIGRAVEHSTDVIYLDYDYGIPLCYLAEIAGEPWPESEDMEIIKLAGRQELSWDSRIDAEERFNACYLDSQPQFFVVCRLMYELDVQRGLRDFLFSYPVSARGERYIVFDLRHPRAASGKGDGS